jgi:hypothetical protein
MQDLTLYYLFLKCNLMHYYFDKILLFINSGCYILQALVVSEDVDHIPQKIMPP